MSVVFDPNFYPRRVVLVGCGGTGAQWARSIARMLVDMRSRRLSLPEFIIIDPDKVEDKNVGRQMFTPADVGHYKAQVLASRFNLALGLEIGWLNEPFDPKPFHKHTAMGQSLDPETLYCGAVDNHHARRQLNSVFYQTYRAVWIDAGNHATSGQVIIGNTNNIAQIKFEKKWNQDNLLVSYLPVATRLFPSLLDPEPVDVPRPDASCADLLAAGEQHLLVNDLMATIAAGYTFKLLYRQPITSFITYCDIDTMGVRSIQISKDDLEFYLGEQPDSFTPALSDASTGLDDNDEMEEEWAEEEYDEEEVYD